MVLKTQQYKRKIYLLKCEVDPAGSDACSAVRRLEKRRWGRRNKEWGQQTWGYINNLICDFPPNIWPFLSPLQIHLPLRVNQMLVFLSTLFWHLFFFFSFSRWSFLLLWLKCNLDADSPQMLSPAQICSLSVWLKYPTIHLAVPFLYFRDILNLTCL